MIIIEADFLFFISSVFVYGFKYIDEFNSYCYNVMLAAFLE